MKNKKQSAADSIKALLNSTKGETVAPKTTTPPKIEKVKTGKEINSRDKREKNGGARSNSGRKPGGTALQKRLLRQLMAEHFSEKIKVKVKDPKTGVEHVIEKPRVLVAIDTLFHIGVDNKNDTALDRWLNRALGKAPQPLIGDEEEDPVRIDLGVERILKKAYGLPEDDEDDE